MDVILRNDVVDKARAGDRCLFTGCLIVVPDISQVRKGGGGRWGEMGDKRWERTSSHFKYLLIIFSTKLKMPGVRVQGIKDKSEGQDMRQAEGSQKITPRTFLFNNLSSDSYLFLM